MCFGCVIHSLQLGGCDFSSFSNYAPVGTAWHTHRHKTTHRHDPRCRDKGQQGDSGVRTTWTCTKMYSFIQIISNFGFDFKSIDWWKNDELSFILKKLTQLPPTEPADFTHQLRTNKFSFHFFIDFKVLSPIFIFFPFANRSGPTPSRFSFTLLLLSSPVAILVPIFCLPILSASKTLSIPYIFSFLNFYLFLFHNFILLYA